MDLILYISPLNTQKNCVQFHCDRDHHSAALRSHFRYVQCALLFHTSTLAIPLPTYPNISSSLFFYPYIQKKLKSRTQIVLHLNPLISPRLVAVIFFQGSFCKAFTIALRTCSCNGTIPCSPPSYI